MKGIIGSIFILIFLISCQLNTSKTIITADNIVNQSKANITFSGEINNGICINCSQ